MGSGLIERVFAPFPVQSKIASGKGRGWGVRKVSYLNHAAHYGSSPPLATTGYRTNSNGQRAVRAYLRLSTPNSLLSTIRAWLLSCRNSQSRSQEASAIAVTIALV